MKKKFIATLLILVAFVASSCTSSPSASTLTSEIESNPTTVATTTEQTTTAEQTIAPTTTVTEAIPTPEPTTPIEGAYPILRNSGVRLIPGTTYLKSEETVVVIDETVVDGLSPFKDGEIITLPVGTILFLMDENLDPIYGALPEVFYTILLDGRTVAFAQTTGEDGAIRLNGKTTAEIFGVDPNRVSTGEASPDTTTVDQQIVAEVDLPKGKNLNFEKNDYEIINIRIDWNGDGSTDTFRREYQEDGEYKYSVVLYTDGATGEVTDVTSYFGGEGGFSDQILWIEESDGTPVLVDNFDEYDSVFFATYVPGEDQPVERRTQYRGSYDYDDGVFAMDRSGYLFGNLIYITCDMKIEDGFFVETKSPFVEWYADGESIVRDQADLTYGYFSCTLVDLTVKDEEGKDFILPAGRVIFPLYIESENALSEQATLHFYLADGTFGTLVFDRTISDGGYSASVNGIDAYDVFWCSSGG